MFLRLKIFAEIAKVSHFDLLLGAYPLSIIMGFFENKLLYHYIIPFFIPDSVLRPEVWLSAINIATPVFF